MDKLIELIRVIWRNPKVTIPILFIVFPSLAGNAWFISGLYTEPEPVKPIEDLIAAPRVMNEIVIPKMQPHVHPLIEHDHELKSHEHSLIEHAHKDLIKMVEDHATGPKH